MRFTLTYRGPLPTSRAAQGKHDLRRALHPQLRELWAHEPLANHRHWYDPDSDPVADAEHDGAGDALFTGGRGHRFAVLVRRSIKLIAELDILLLRP